MPGKINASLNEMLSNVKWGVYTLSDLFIKKTVKGVPKNEENLTPNEKGYHMFGQNIMYQYPQKILLSEKYLHIVDEEYPILAYTSSVGEIGLIKESFYRSGDNGAFQGLYSKNHKFTLRELQFILSVIKKHFQFFGYETGMANVMSLKIELPIKNNEVDYDFINSFVAKLEALRVAELETYLTATGVKNYILTREEEAAINNYQSLVWETYNLKKLYGESTRGKRLKSADRILGKLPFVTAGEADEGVSDFIGNEVQVFSKNTTTIDMFGSAKYRNYDYGGDDHIAVVHTENLPADAAVFVTAAINRASHNGQFSYDKNFYAKDADALDIMLPTINGSPDYNIMQLIVSAIKKMVIKDVVLYADRKINAITGIVTAEGNTNNSIYRVVEN